MGLSLLLISTLALSFFSTTSIFDELYPEAVAQQDVQTTKYRNLVIDLSNGVKTNAQLNLPAIGEGQFPVVLLVPGAGPADMNYVECFRK